MKLVLACAIAVLALLLGRPANAAPAPLEPGLAVSGNLTWEQLRFYGPSGSASSLYTGGQPTALGALVAGNDLCSGRDICGSSLRYGTLLGGQATVTATTTATGTAVVHQDLDPTYAGLGVNGYQPAASTQQWAWNAGVRSSKRIPANVGNASYGHYATVVTPARFFGGDEINAGDKLTVSFGKEVRLLGMHFFDANHGQNRLSGDKFGLSIDGGPMVNYSFAGGYPFNAHSTLVGSSFTFSRASSRGEDYYLGALKFAAVATAPVPEPASLALLLAGLAVVGGRWRHGAAKARVATA